MAQTPPRSGPSDYETRLRPEDARPPEPGSERERQQEDVRRYVERQPTRLPAPPSDPRRD